MQVLKKLLAADTGWERPRKQATGTTAAAAGYRVGVFGKANATYAPGMGAVDAGCPGLACVCVVARAAAQ